MQEAYSTTSGRGSISENDESQPKYYYRRVSIPKKPTFAKELASTVQETLFPEGIFRKLPEASSSGGRPENSLYLALSYIFPILRWIRGYDIRTFKDDLIAGLTIGSLAIPQDIGYSKLAGLPPIYGLCKTVQIMYIYASSLNIVLNQ